MAINTRVTKRPISRAVKRVLKAQATQDGAGVSLYRAIGIPALREVDPFLLLDEMHSDQPLAGLYRYTATNGRERN